MEVFYFGHGSTHLYFYTFSGTLTYKHIMLAAHIFFNIICKLITCNTYGIIAYYTSQRYYGNICCSTANIHNKVTHRFLYIYTYTNSGSHRLVTKINFLPSCMFSRITHCALLNRSNT